MSDEDELQCSDSEKDLDENDEIQVQLPSDKASDDIVRSVDVPNPPEMFQILLRQHTNLNTPPSNWLHGRWKSHVHQGSFPFENYFSSLTMANQFLELTGDVDVISDSKNIKKLLKMTLSKANVSMIVHRVHNTLLLDNFDIHSLLKQKTRSWELFKRFYFETLAEDTKLSVVERKNKRRDHLQSQNMFSKLLYYCLADEQQPPDTQSKLTDHAKPEPNQLNHRAVVWNFEDIRMLIGTDLPIFGGGTHPCVSLKLRDMRKPINVLTGLDNWLDNLMCNVPDLAMCYHDNGIVQSYELLKTEDIPNCSDCRFSPNVIKDIAQNILSFLKSNATKEGHTYWLYKAHGGDIVKLYDLTTLYGNSDGGKVDEPIENPFTIPVGVLFYRLARNIKVRQKCPSRGKKAKVVEKLLQNSLLLLDPCKHYQIIASCHYFLCDLFVCDHLEEEPSDSESSESDIDLSPQNDLSDEEKENKTSQKSKSNKDSHTPRGASIKVEALTTHRKSNKKHLNKRKEASMKTKKAPVQEEKEKDPIELFSNSFKHISHASKNIEKFHSSLESKKSSKFNNDNLGSKSTIPEELARCNPNEAIPLHYSPLKPNLSLEKTQQVGAAAAKEGPSKPCGEVCEKKQALSLRDIESPFSNTSIEEGRWLAVSKIFLIRKTTVVLVKRAKFKLEKFLDASAALQDGFSAVRCYCALAKMISDAFPMFGPSKPRKNLAEDVYGKCFHDPFLFVSVAKLLGDVYLKLAMTSCEARADDIVPSEEEQNVLDFIDGYITKNDIPFNMLVSNDKNKIFAQSLDYYVLAQDIIEDYEIFPFGDDKRNAEHKFVIDLLKRKANVCNEYGKYFVQQVVLPNDSINENWSKLLDEAQDKYKASFKIFNHVNDGINAAIVLLNEVNCLGNRIKLIQSHLPPEKRNQFSNEERNAYHQAEACLNEGLVLLESRKKNKDLWETFVWEFSNIHIVVGNILFGCVNNADTRSKDSVKEMVGYYEKALNYCTFEKNSSRYILGQFRKGGIHRKLGNVSLSVLEKECLNKESYDEASKHFDQSYEAYWTVKSSVELLGVHIDRIVLKEKIADVAPSATKLESLFGILELLLNSTVPLGLVKDMLNEMHHKLFIQFKISTNSFEVINTEDSMNDLGNVVEVCKLAGCLVSILMSTFLRMLKECRARCGEGDLFKRLKSMYNKCLSSKIVSISWDKHAKEWQALSIQASEMKKFFLTNDNNSSKIHNRNAKASQPSSKTNESLFNDSTKPFVDLSKIRHLVSACDFFIDLFIELQRGLPGVKNYL